MPLSRFSRLPEAKQAELLRIATDELAEHGFDEASLSDVLVKAGLSKSSFYYYFEDKEDLLATVLERLLDAYFEQFKPGNLDALTAETFWPFFEHTLTRSAELLVSSPTLMKIMSHLPMALRANPRLGALRNRANEHLRQGLVAGQRVGCVRADLSVDRLIDVWEAVDEVMDRALMGTQVMTSQEQLKAHMELVFDMFRRIMSSSGGQR